MKIDVIIPVYRPTEKLHKVLYGLSRQTYLPEQIILLHTRDGIKLDVSACKDRVSVTEIPILEKEFDHGRTRDLGIRMSDADIVVMMTQDAVPADLFLLEKLSEALKEHPDAVAAYARQIPDQNCGLLEKYTRVFNYPPKSQIKSQKDLPELGIKTYFCSNVCAAYRRGVYLELGGFPHPVIFNEDLIFAAGAVRSGWKIIYKADARVIHSHEYTYRELIRRNFDQGVSQACHPEIFGKVKSEKEGMHLICTLVKKLLKERKYLQIMQLFVESGCKYLGYQMGKHYGRLPESLIMKLTLNRNYWIERSDEDA